MKNTPWCMCPAPLTIWPPQLRTTVPSYEMSPKWAFTAIIWFRYSALEASCAVFFLKENILPRGPQAAVLLLDGLNNSFGRMETQQQWGLLKGEQACSEGNQEPSVLLRLDNLANHFLVSFLTLCWADLKRRFLHSCSFVYVLSLGYPKGGDWFTFLSLAEDNRMSQALI